VDGTIGKGGGSGTGESVRAVSKWKIVLVFSTLAGCAGRLTPLAHCPGGFEGSFIQIDSREESFTVAAWRRELALLRSVGVRRIILQYTGDQSGPYDRREGARSPVAALLEAASREGMEVLLGLHEDRRWPDRFTGDEIPPPLHDEAEARRLGAEYGSSRAFAGWYIPHEIDDATWGTEDGARRLNAFLRRTTERLHALVPGRPVAIAPFFTRTLRPRAHARWWRTVLAGSGVNVLILQDGVGTSRASPEQAALYLRELRPVLALLGIRLWSVVELFRQLHGEPVDGKPFAAVPARFEVVRRSLGAEWPWVERTVAFAVPNHMDPERGPAQARLHREYVRWCKERLAGSR
jgi:hypothetical protein